MSNRQAQQELQDVRILQKVNAAHREAFKEKYPGQVEHCLRLTSERLQALLTKRADTDIQDPSTWNGSTTDILNLAQSIYYLDCINRSNGTI